MAADVTDIILQLGAAGAVTYVCYLLIERYSKLTTAALEEISKVNQLRVEEAQKQIEQIKAILAVQVQFMQHISVCAVAMKESADAMADLSATLRIENRPGGKGGGR